MCIEFAAFAHLHRLGDHATHPLARPARRLALHPQGVGRIGEAAKAATNPLSLILAGMSLRRRRFAPDTRLIAPSGASNCGS
jgi:hypothetical protein